MTNKTRVLHVRVVGFSAPEKQMLNSIFLLSVAPARQIGYKLWNPETGAAPDLYLLDGDSESAVLSWQAAFSNTAERTLVVGAKNTDLGVASAARPLGLKVVGAMDRLAIAINNKLAKENAGLDVSAPRVGSGTLPTSAGTLPTSAGTLPTNGGTLPTNGLSSGTLPTSAAGMTHNAPAPAPAASAAPAAPAAPAADQNTSLPRVPAYTRPPIPDALAASINALGSSLNKPVSNGTLPTSMTAQAPAATVLPNVTLQPNVAPDLAAKMDRTLDKSINERPVPEKTVDKILSEKPAVEKSFVAEKPVVVEKPVVLEKPSAAAAALMSSGVTPLSPAALSAAVAPVSTSSTRTNLRVVPSVSPLAASLPAAAPVSRIAEAPMVAPLAPTTARIADVPMTAPVAPAPAAPSITAPSITAPVTPVATPVMVAAPAAAAPAVVPVAATPVAAAPTAPVPVMPTSTPTPRHEEQVFRVLAVDDSPLMRTFLQNKLAPYGISPDFAASGEEALFKISKQHFDMIFLDVMLPGMDGYDVCKMIKKNKDNNLMKVVMLTSKDKTFDKIRGTMAGCDGYLTKPVDETKLRAIIERHTVTRK
ncbi:MAG TPA: response regulator [Steroidobacteraceae bacterium]|nr:response regulator [Steroidobacteraceae bacterium]